MADGRELEPQKEISGNFNAFWRACAPATKVLSLSLALGSLGGAFYSGWEFGEKLSDRESAARVAGMTSAIENREREIAELKSALEQARADLQGEKATNAREREKSAREQLDFRRNLSPSSDSGAPPPKPGSGGEPLGAVLPAGKSGSPPNDSASVGGGTVADPNPVAGQKPVRLSVLEIAGRSSARTGKGRVTITLSVKNTASDHVVLLSANRLSSFNKLVDNVGGNEYSCTSQSAPYDGNVRAGMDPSTATRLAASGVRVGPGESIDLSYEFSTNRDWRKPDAYEFSGKIFLLTPTKKQGAGYDVAEYPVTVPSIAPL